MSKIECSITLGEYNKLEGNKSKDLQVINLESMTIFDLQDCKNLLRTNPEYNDSYVTILTPDGKVINTFIKLKELKELD